MLILRFLAAWRIGNNIVLRRYRAVALEYQWMSSIDRHMLYEFQMKRNGIRIGNAELCLWWTSLMEPINWLRGEPRIRLGALPENGFWLVTITDECQSATDQESYPMICCALRRYLEKITNGLLNILFVDSSKTIYLLMYTDNLFSNYRINFIIHWLLRQK